MHITATRTAPVPGWALRQRHLISVMNETARMYQTRYTRADGTFVWRDRWPGMDGSDDGYESYHNWPLFYALGGAADLHEQSRMLWGRRDPAVHGLRPNPPRVRRLLRLDAPMGSRPSTSTTSASRIRSGSRTGPGPCASPTCTRARIRRAPNWDPELRQMRSPHQRQPRPAVRELG